MRISTTVLRENGKRRAVFIDSDTGDEVNALFEVDKACAEAFDTASTRIVEQAAPTGQPGCRRFNLRLAYAPDKALPYQQVVWIANRVATALGLAFLVSQDLGPRFNVTFEVVC